MWYTFFWIQRKGVTSAHVAIGLATLQRHTYSEDSDPMLCKLVKKALVHSDFAKTFTAPFLTVSALETE